MIINANLPKSLWAEAVATAVYVRNIIPTRTHKAPSTHYQIWYGEKPNISHLRVLGCMAYAHIPDAIRRKLDDKAESMTFVG